MGSGGALRLAAASRLLPLLLLPGWEWVPVRERGLKPEAPPKQFNDRRGLLDFGFCCFHGGSGLWFGSEG